MGPLGTNPIIFVSLGIAEISRFPKISIFSKVVLFKTFLQHFLNYASTINIQELSKFYNIGQKSFETDLNLQHSKGRKYLLPSFSICFYSF